MERHSIGSVPFAACDSGDMRRRERRDLHNPVQALARREPSEPSPYSSNSDSVVEPNFQDEEHPRVKSKVATQGLSDDLAFGTDRSVVDGPGLPTGIERCRFLVTPEPDDPFLGWSSLYPPSRCFPRSPLNVPEALSWAVTADPSFTDKRTGDQ